MRIILNITPEELMEEYQGNTLVENWYIYFEINKGMYGLPQEGSPENKLLQKRLAMYGSRTTPHIPGLWRNETISIQFSLVVDEFGVEYKRKEDT